MMGVTKRIIWWLFVAIEVAIWPLGLWLMLTSGSEPDVVAHAMATLILIAFLPLFWASS